MKLLAIGAAILLILFPVVILPHWGLGFEQTKVVFFIILTGLTVLLSNRSIKQQLPRISQIMVLSLIFLAILLLSTLFSINPTLSLYGQQPYYQGWILYLCLWLSFLAWRSLRISGFFLVITLAICSIWITALAFKEFIELNYLNYQILNYDGRVVSTFGQPNFFAGFLVLCLPLFLFETGQNRRLGYIVAPITLFGIVLSESRASLAIAVTIIVIWLSYQLKPKLRYFAWGAGLTTLLVSLFGSYVLLSGLVWKELDHHTDPLFFLHDRANRGFYLWQAIPSSHPEMRYFITPVVGQLALAKPWLGWGLGTLEQTFATASLTDYHGLKNVLVDSAHNYLLDIWYSSGLFALLSWLGLFILAWRSHQQLPWRLSLLAYFLLILVQNQSVVHLAFFWMLLGLADRGERPVEL